MDEEIEAGLDAVDTEDAVEETGGLSVYKDPNVQSAVAERNKLNAEYKKYYDDLTAKIMAQRTGPTFSERMFQLSAALAQPTTRRGFGGVLENITPVLAAQQKAQREGMIKRQDALSALQAAQLGQRVGLANQDVTTALAMAKINNKPVVGVDVGGVLRNRSTNQPIGAEYNRVPKAEYYAWIEKNATPTDLAAALEFYPTFTVELKAAFDRGAKNKGR
jgi:hypothetical protein